MSRLALAMARTLRYAPPHRRYELPSAFWLALTRLAIKRLQRTAVPASKLACTSAADPQRRYAKKEYRISIGAFLTSVLK
ncbi:hypothetical protein KJ590_04930 [Patescibacteria group bacterium]|nr:hypothetical protein [Patescibacteria group bacterium]